MRFLRVLRGSRVLDWSCLRDDLARVGAWYETEHAVERAAS